jgi:hypothetical protein
MALMPFVRALQATGALVAILAAEPVLADALSTPECRRDLATANGLIDAIAAREKQFVPNNLVKNCQLLKQNLVDMVKAREPMDRCLTGHEHGETVGQMDASIGDIRAVLAAKCQK